ncbi:MAG TPA: Kdo hydroxylase family protein [Acidobacteriaceae bacterium]
MEEGKGALLKMVTISLEEIAGAGPEQAVAWCTELERGEILYFPQTPVALPAEELSFLLGQQQKDSSLHKNIAYKPLARAGRGALSGLDTRTAEAAEVARLARIMRGYSGAVTAFLTSFLTPYAGRWRLDYASFRPQEEQSRDLPTRKRNDLLHTDAFPTRPTHGARILRFFNNIHPERTRDWVVGEPFARLVARFAPGEIAPRPDSPAAAVLKSVGRSVGLGAALPAVKRTPYDDFMMRFHNFLKENARFQAETERTPVCFPAGSSWMVYTDTVPHAVLAGQYALEQTLLVDAEAMVAPEHAPLRVLEAMAGQRLV